ncbi:MAG: 6-phosphogluconate dehydrogenase (decarboxylating), partial [Thiohalorhabdaceae bacterium]
QRLEPAFRSLAPGTGAAERTPGRAGEPAAAERGYLHCGPVGAGHYVKMVHNGIEYGIMQAYAEGFDLLEAADRDEVAETERFDLDTAAIAEVWRRGSVIGSWLLDLTAAALHEDPDLED